MIVVISPAKKLDFDTSAPTKKFSNLKDISMSEKLISELKKCNASKISKMMKLSESLTELNVKRYKDFKTPFNLQNAKQAIFAFKGDTYVGLDAESFTKKDIDYAQKHLRILSGLYGLVSPLDLIQPYRLEMGTKFSCDGSKDLYDFWSGNITSQLNQVLRKEKTLVNCASGEYFKSVNTKLLKDVKVITPSFKEGKNGEFKMIGLFAKKARGMMSRFIIQNEIESSKDIQAFNLDGYKFNKKLSSDLSPVFTR
ncbi:MAG: peroxide stress protein YaaA [Halobacteriovoraceae bacterium]|nr:peroxide stress protein YaaA [Halobacteriovoraceae bacterium]